MSDETRQLLVFGTKTFRITVPKAAKITFGPFSPPTKGGYGMQPSRAEGTLRIYDKGKEQVIAVFSGVTGYRDLSLDYEEEVAVEEGARIWKSDQHGYSREEKVNVQKQWVAGPTPALAPSEDDNPF